MHGLVAAIACGGSWIWILFALGGLHAVASVGVTGGPCHGEHPLIINVLHTGFFLVMAWGWTWPRWHLYGLMLLGALALSLWAIPLAFAGRPGLTWLTCGLMASLYGGMAYLIVHP